MFKEEIMNKIKNQTVSIQENYIRGTIKYAVDSQLQVKTKTYIFENTEFWVENVNLQEESTSHIRKAAGNISFFAITNWI